MFVCVFECVFLRVFEFVRNRVQEGPQNSLYPSIKLLNILHKKMQERQPSFTGVHCARVCCMCMISFKSLQQETAYIFICVVRRTHTLTHQQTVHFCLAGGRMMKSVESWIQKSLYDNAVTDDHFQDTRAYRGTPSFGPHSHGPYVPRSDSFFGTIGHSGMPSTTSISPADSRPQRPNLEIGSV